MSKAAILLAAFLALTGCTPKIEEFVRPEEIKDFATLFSQNCSGCHGPDGRGGAAQPLNDPVYQHLIDKEHLRTTIAQGRPGTAMPGFSKGSGGLLTDEQIAVLVDTMQGQWRGSAEVTGIPAYEAPSAKGDPARGEAAFRTFCANCHSPDGRKRGGSVVDPQYLALVSDQSLRTTTIAGRADMRIPDWRNYVPGRPMSGDEIADVVAWIASHRPAAATQAGVLRVQENPRP